MSEKRDDKIQVRLTSTEKEAFTAIAERGGRTPSGLLRHLLRQKVKEAGGEYKKAIEEPIKESRDYGVMVRLNASEKRALITLSDAMGMSQQRTLVSLLRATAENAALITKDEMDELLANRMELQKIGVNLNQIARAINTERKAGTFTATTVDLDKLIHDAKQASVSVDKTKEQIIALMKASRTRIAL